MTSGLLAAGRALAQSLQESTVKISRKTGEARNPANGKLEPTWETVYEGPGRVREGGAQPQDVDASGQRAVEQRPTVSLPIGADDRITTGTSAAVRADDEGVVVTNPHDPERVGLKFRVAGPHDQTHSTARRLPVEVYTYG